MIKLSKITRLALVAFILTTSGVVACGQSQPASSFPNTVAVAWTNLQQRLIKSTPGFGPGPAGRTFTYAGLAMYETVVPGMPGYQSLLHQLAPDLPASTYDRTKTYHWPAAVNAALKVVLTGFFAGTSVPVPVAARNVAAIDSLSAVFTSSFQRSLNNEQLMRSAAYGKATAEQVLGWSKTDGTFASNPPFVAPAGPGKYVKTPEAFLDPVGTYVGLNRPFTTGLLGKVTVPPPAIDYSEVPASPYYAMAKDLYDQSQRLTEDQVHIAKTWGDIPGNYNNHSHLTNMLTQIVVKENLALDETALLYAKNGIALFDAGIVIFKAKYLYNCVRPITFIRTVMKIPGWNTVIPTPAHPEYPAAHAVLAGATSEILKARFGNQYAVSDRSHETLYGVRHYKNIDEYAWESAMSRAFAGIHYVPTLQISLPVGQQVGKLVNDLPFKK